MQGPGGGVGVWSERDMQVLRARNAQEPHLAQPLQRPQSQMHLPRRSRPRLHAFMIITWVQADKIITASCTLRYLRSRKDGTAAVRDPCLR